MVRIAIEGCGATTGDPDFWTFIERFLFLETGG
jgi:hypothetical protein